MSTFKKILCPTDFSEASYEAIQRAVELVGHGPTEICVVHVEAPNEVVTPMVGLRPDAEDETTRRVAAVQNLRAALEERVPPHVRTRPILQQGDAAEQIVRTAAQEGVDLIVLTTHGAAGWRPGVLGAVAETVVRTAECPVLTVSGPASRHNSTTRSNGHGVARELRDLTLKADLEVVHSNHALYLDGD